MYLLQEKINSYLAIIESGEIYEKYPKAASIVAISLAAHAAFHPVFLQSCLVFQGRILATTI